MSNKYFTGFPKVKFDNKIITDITKRLNIIKGVRNNTVVYENITVTSGHTPEQIAHKYYGDPDLFWVVLYLNDIVDPYTDWLMTEEQLQEYVSCKYGVENIYNVHHWETTSQSDMGAGIWVNQGTPFSKSITNMEYEDLLNEKKRQIKMLKPFYLRQIVQEYIRAF